jgi:predicted nucleic acid-binding protein
MARDRGVRLTGTIGVLIELVDVGEIDVATADAWLKRLVDETNYRAPSREFTDYL